jgi:Zn finger protein HypA/HybF involved in hydrogenase expression
MSRRFSKNDFIEKSIKFHGDSYDYRLVEYKNDLTDVEIICKIHGVFYQKPNVHYRSGCSKCGLLKRSNLRKNSIDELLSKFEDKHGNKFDYSNMNYIKMRSKVEIKCNKHNIFFLQTPLRHLSSKTGGCPKCNSIGKGTMTTETFIEKSKEKHGCDKYIYDSVHYIKSHKKVKIVCKNHGEFEIVPNSHINGRGCPTCGRNGGVLENKWLDSLNVPNELRQFKVGNYYVDGIDLSNRIVYEFYGDFWHGNSNIYSKDEINKILKITFGELYDKTINREKEIESLGYKVISIWECDYKNNLII